MAVMAAIIAALLLVDAAFAIRLASTHTTALPEASSRQTAGGHPCNHGFYVSQAAHTKNGGKYVSGIAQGKLGKDGNCSAPLPK